MGKKKTKGHRKASRSDKRMQKLYNDAIKEVKKRNINLDDLPAKNADDVDEASEEREEDEHLDTQKTRKKPKQVLKETLTKQEQLRKPRVSLSVPVSKLVPFKPDEKGLEFPRDFRRDPTSLSWIPRNSPGFPLFAPEQYNARRSPSSEYGDEFEKTISCNDLPAQSNDLSVDEILQVLPLRIGDEDSECLPEASTRSSQLPPIYRQDLWQETMRRASTSSRSIPAKQDAWSIRDPASLMVGRQELYSREKFRSTISLAERRFRLRAASSSAVLPSRDECFNL
ncbi:uncharacterized protein LOC144655869 [Oculina patagonica]